MQVPNYPLHTIRGRQSGRYRPAGSRTELKGSINLWGSEGGRLRIYMVEAGFSHANAFLTKQRNKLNLENRGDLRLKLANFKPNINSLAAAHQAHPSH
ncbi:hypothetical protein FHG87_000376 [Trinorchestia longiramus]|nr:hypothetical protein FHG87_000376 [Trinorchestia longiramus]